MVFSNDGKNTDHKGNQEGPEKTRHSVKIMAQELDGKAGRVEDGDIVAQDGEHEQDKS